ncbi:MAG: lysophospholipid acyltransferase family protein [Desulfobacterales bacterium]
MKPLVRGLYKVYAFLVFAPLLGLSTLFFGTLTVVLLFFLPPSTVSRICGKTWARFNSRITPIWVRVYGREHMVPGQSYVIVSNHQSHYDIFVLYGWLDVDFRWVMKQELRKVPFIGIACHRLGHIFIDRGNRTAAMASIEAAKQRITGGTSVLFFPEGTRSRSGRLRPFKKGAFMMALDLQVPILPVSIAGTRSILPADTIDLFPGKVDMRIHPPIPTAGFGVDSIQELMERTRRAIDSGL